jgi:hypothetical protein
MAEDDLTVDHPAPPFPGHPTFQEFLDLQAEAKAHMDECDKHKDQVCLFCGMPPFYFPADKAYVKGHIYSEAGLREVQISQVCEHCFDEVATEVVEEQVAEAQARVVDPDVTLEFLDESVIGTEEFDRRINEIVDEIDSQSEQKD